jgi:hypothetical protein
MQFGGPFRSNGPFAAIGAIGSAFTVSLYGPTAGVAVLEARSIQK